MNLFEKLGLGGWEILFHFINLTILVVALYFLLFKPVKRIIKTNRDKLNAIVEENDKLNSEAIEMKHKYEKMVADVKEEAVKIVAETTEKTKQKADETLNEARLQAQAIIESAKRDAEAENKRLKQDYQKKVSDIAITMAEKVLEREVNKDDNKKVIDECLKEWD